MNKFNAKNLSYESNEPSFLRKLRGEFGGTDAVRHERPVPRPRKVVPDGDDEDQPTYVVEDSQDTLSKEEYEALMLNKENDVNGEGKQQIGDDGSALTRQPPTEEKSSNGIEVGPIKEQMAAIGVAKKKRAIVAVGTEDRDAGLEVKDKKHTKVKKSKKVKLSFDDAS